MKLELIAMAADRIHAAIGDLALDAIPTGDISTYVRIRDLSRQLQVNCRDEINRSRRAEASNAREKSPVQLIEPPY
jgi:hypothetical protein